MTEDQVMKTIDPEVLSTCETCSEYSPHIDVVETKDEFRVEVELPGVRAQDVDVDLENGMLRIRGKATPRDESGHRVRVRELSTGDFVRTLRLSDSIDSGRIQAKTKDGLLTLHLPKVGALVPRSIPVISAN